jgi:hypothetical protein
MRGECHQGRNRIQYIIPQGRHTVAVYGPYNKEVRTFCSTHHTHANTTPPLLLGSAVGALPCFSCLAAVKLGQTNEEREGKEKKRKLSVTGRVCCAVGRSFLTVQLVISRRVHFSFIHSYCYYCWWEWCCGNCKVLLVFIYFIICGSGKAYCLLLGCVFYSSLLCSLTFLHLKVVGTFWAESILR